MKSFHIPVIVEPDEERWFAYIPELEEIGGATWGYTRDEALKNIQEVAQMIIEEMLEDGKPLPACISERNYMSITVNI